MSETAADSYPGHTITSSSSAQPDDQGLNAYNESDSDLRDKLSGVVYGGDQIPPMFKGHPPTTDSGLPHLIPQTSGDHVSQNIFSPAASQQLPFPPPYSYEHLDSPRSPFQPRSARNNGHLPQQMPSFSSLLEETDSSAAGPSTLIDPSLHHQLPTLMYYDPVMSHNTFPKHLLPKRHHHRLPRSANRNKDVLARYTRPPSMIGKVGMPSPMPRPKKLKSRFTAADDALLIHLKEDKNLAWLQIEDFFPGRSHNTLQVRYCQRLKTKAVNWTDEKVQRLRRAIDEYEADRWRIIADKVGRGLARRRVGNGPRFWGRVLAKCD